MAEQRGGACPLGRGEARDRRSSSRSIMPERVDRDPGVELHAAFGRGHDVAFEELAHRLHELGRGRSVLGHRSPASVEDVEQVPFGLGDAAAERRELDRSHEAVEVRERLTLADHAPLQRAEPDPEPQRVLVDRARRRRARTRRGDRRRRRSRRRACRGRRTATTSRTASRGPRPGRRGARAPSRARRGCRRARR